MNLYADYHPQTSIKGFGFANKEKAEETIKKLDIKNKKMDPLIRMKRKNYHVS